MGVKIVPDLTIIEEGVGPAIDVWPDTAAGTPVTPPVYPPASWSQATWFVDPQNVTGNASDSNSGLTVADPVLSYNGGIVLKWGTVSPTLRQSTTLTWLSSQLDNSDPVVFTGIVVAPAIVIITAPLGPAQQVYAGVLGAVVSKNRNTPQLLTADLGFAATTLNSLVLNTTHNSFAWVYQNVAGTVFAMTQPLVPMPVPLDASGNSGLQTIAEVDTWATGDAFVVYEPILVNIIKLSPIADGYISGTPFLATPMQVQHITIASPPPEAIGFTDVFIDADVNIVECASLALVVNGTVATDSVTYYLNDFFGQSAFAAAGANPLSQFYAGALITTVASADAMINWNVDFDVILDGTNAPIQLHKLVFLSFEPGVGHVYVTGVSRFFGPWSFGSVAVGQSSIVWGPGTIDTGGAARLSYQPLPAAGAVSTFKVATLLLNGESLANPFSRTTGTYEPAITITAAALDAAFGVAGFGGTAVNVGGSSYTNQGTP